VQVSVRGPKLNEAGLLLDFSDLKKALRSILGELDHQYLNDLPAFAERNTSAENIALHVYERLAGMMGEALASNGARIVEVSVQETDTATAVYRPE
jgi:6-pyruvoyltetrahydropterin/6-carboxytetrahydropterin synthase